MSAISQARQRLIERRRGMETDSPLDRTSARARLRRAAHNVDSEFSPANLLRGQLDHHPYLTIAAAVGAGAATEVIGRRTAPVLLGVIRSGLLPLVSRYALAWLLRGPIR